MADAPPRNPRANRRHSKVPPQRETHHSSIQLSAIVTRSSLISQGSDHSSSTEQRRNSGTSSNERRRSSAGSASFKRKGRRRSKFAPQRETTISAKGRGTSATAAAAAATVASARASFDVELRFDIDSESSHNSSRLPLPHLDEESEAPNDGGLVGPFESSRKRRGSDAGSSAAPSKPIRRATLVLEKEDNSIVDGPGDEEYDFDDDENYPEEVDDEDDNVSKLTPLPRNPVRRATLILEDLEDYDEFNEGSLELHPDNLMNSRNGLRRCTLVLEDHANASTLSEITTTDFGPARVKSGIGNNSFGRITAGGSTPHAPLRRATIFLDQSAIDQIMVTFEMCECDGDRSCEDDEELDEGEDSHQRDYGYENDDGWNGDEHSFESFPSAHVRPPSMPARRVTLVLTPDDFKDLDLD